MREPLDLPAFRAAHGLTQRQAAAALGVPLRTWQGWERGKPCENGALRVLLEMLAVEPGLWATVARVVSPCT
jgi:DNA-binding transcriptional regulator YiaG